MTAITNQIFKYGMVSMLCYSHGFVRNTKIFRTITIPSVSIEAEYVVPGLDTEWNMKHQIFCNRELNGEQLEVGIALIILFSVSLDQFL